MTFKTRIVRCYSPYVGTWHAARHDQGTSDRAIKISLIVCL